MEVKPTTAFLVRPKTKIERFWIFVKMHSKPIIVAIIVAAIGIPFFMYETIWKNKWEFEKLKTQTLLMLNAELEYNYLELDTFNSSVLKLREYIHDPKYVYEINKKLPEVFNIKKYEKSYGELKIEIPHLKNNVISSLHEKGIGLEMLNKDDKHFILKNHKEKYDVLYRDIITLIEDYNEMFLKIIEHDKGFPIKMGELEWTKQGRELENRLKDFQEKITAANNDVSGDIVIFKRIYKDIEKYINNQR